MSVVYKPPADKGLDILYQDDFILALNKPSGLLSVPGKGIDKQDSLSFRVQKLFPQAEIVHRLDMPTSGIMLMALSKPLQRDLSQLFQSRNISKTYLAVVSGHPDPSKGSINLPLITDWPNRPRQKVDFELGKTSETSYEVLSVDKQLNTSHVKLTPITGRSHQLRVHMTAIGHPILGDELYASESIRTASSRLLLHAQDICFIHPVTGSKIHIHSPAGF